MKALKSILLSLALLLALSLALFIIQPLTASQTVRIATTTSTENSGLLANILPSFEKQSGYKVHIIAVGTGKALELGRRGDVDVILVHAKNAENTFVKEGYGVKRFDVMYNDFILVGPNLDSAKVRGSSKIADALSNINQHQSIFISRGDNSGTHKKEKHLWQQSGQSIKGSWYREVGQGMGKTLMIANEMQGYTLIDRGTWLAFKDKVDLKLLVEGDTKLFNPYGIIAINPKKHSTTNIKAANEFIRWITSPSTQAQIADFKISGQQLFIPSAH